MFRSALTAALALSYFGAPVLAEDLGSVTDFKRSVVPAKTADDGRVMLKKNSFGFPVDIVDQNEAQRLVQVKSGDELLWVRLSDVETEGYLTVVKKPCLTGEVRVAQQDTQLGATQMGSGKNHCDTE